MSILRAIQSLSRNILQPIWGRLSDKYGKKRFIALGRSLYGIFLLGLIFFQTPWWFIVLSAGTGVWWSIIKPTWTSLIGDYTEKESRGTSIGDINSISQLGGIIAMIIAFIVGWVKSGEISSSSYRPVIIMAAFFSMISGLLSLLTEQKPPRNEDEPFEIRPLINDLALRRYLIVNSLFGLSMSFAWPLFPFIIGDKLVLNIWQVAVYSIASSITSMLAHKYLGSLMDDIGRRPVIIFSRVALALNPIAYILAQNWVHIVIANILSGLGIGSWISSRATYIIDIAPDKYRGTYLSFNTALFGVATFTGSLAGGFITENFPSTGSGYTGIHIGLVISGILRMITGLLFLTIPETYSVEEELEIF